MHYRNGKEAKNGDVIVSLAGIENPCSTSLRVGILHGATPGNDYCNGYIAPTDGGQPVGACMCDCLHLDDVRALLAEKGLDRRPAGK